MLFNNIKDLLPTIGEALKDLTQPFISYVFQQRKHSKANRLMILGISSVIIEDWHKAAEYFYQIKIDFKQWQIKYIMAVGLTRACNDKLSEETKVAYGNKASELLSDISMDSSIPESLRPEILVRLGGIKKIIWFAKKKINMLPNNSDDEINDILNILSQGLKSAEKKQQVTWIEEACYQLGCAYAMVNNATQAQNYYDRLGHESDKGIQLEKRILSRYNPDMNLHKELKDN